jgi:hypothetical protein
VSDVTPPETHTSPWKQTVLKQFDTAASAYLFPMPSNFSLYYADMRLTAFHSTDEWLVIFEMIQYARSHLFINELSVYGSHIAQPCIIAYEIVEPLPTAAFRDGNGHFALDKFDFAVKIQGDVHHFTATEDDYRAAGIDDRSGSPLAAQVLRLMVHQQRAAFFLPQTQLLAACHCQQAGLSLFLQADTWQHPDTAADELPSENLCMVALAEALALGDAALFRCSAATANMHWSHWEVEAHHGWE